MKERPILFSGPMVRAILGGRKTQTRRIIKPQPVLAPDIDERTVNPAWQAGFIPVRCPYGQPGDLLWVRETWYAPPKPLNDCLGYAADGGYPHGVTYRKRPSIFMPRPHSRLTLRITKVRVERLQEINQTDVFAEGLHNRQQNEIEARIGKPLGPQECYRDLWDSINGRGSWDTNPWVWVIEFGRIEQQRAAA